MKQDSNLQLMVPGRSRYQDEELDVFQEVCVSDESSASTEPFEDDAVKKVRTREAMGIINKKEERQIPSLSLLKEVRCRINLKMRWLNWMMGRW